MKWADVHIEEARYRQIPEAIYEASREIGDFHIASKRLEYFVNHESPNIAKLRYRGYTFIVNLSLPRYETVHKIVELAKAIDTEEASQVMSPQEKAESSEILTEDLQARILERNKANPAP